MKCLITLAMFGLLLTGCDVPAPAEPATKHECDPENVKLEVVTADQVEKAIASHKDKVVMVDVWFLGCSPCVKKFPHVVDLHSRYVDQGLVVMSVDVMPAEVAYKDKVEKFLKDKCADFPNYIIEDQDSADQWGSKYNLQYTPATLLFDKGGRRIDIAPDADTKEVEAAIEKALKG